MTKRQGEPLLLTIVSYLKRLMNIKLCKRKKSFEPFWRAALTEHGHSSQSADIWKIAKMALFNPCMKFDFFSQINSFEVFKNSP